jgi:hypothetical protein
VDTGAVQVFHGSSPGADDVGAFTVAFGNLT